MTNASEAGRLLAARRRRVTVACAVCGTEITGTTKRKTCSVRCRKALSVQRRRNPESSDRSGGRQ